MSGLLLRSSPAQRPFVPTALTVSTNEITDAVRNAGTSGDGLSAPGGYGIWPAATNKVPNGGFETDLSGWVDQNTVTRTRDTSQHKFGTASQKIVVSAQAFAGAHTNNVSWTNGDVLTASVWINGTAGDKVRGVIYDGTTAIKSANGDNGVTLATTGWQRITWSGTATSSTSAGQVTIDTGAPNQSVTWYIDGVQLETGSIATPYIETNGGTATRAAARVQAPASVLNATQGWVAFAFKAGIASSNAGLVDPPFMQWQLDSNHVLWLRYNTSGGNQRWQVINNVNGSDAAAVADTFAIGDVKVVVFPWTATTIGVSAGGAAFTSASRAHGVAQLGSLIDLGYDGINGNRQPCSNYLWVAAGLGTLTNADAATINAWGSTPPSIRQLRALNAGQARATFLWDCLTATALAVGQ